MEVLDKKGLVLTGGGAEDAGLVLAVSEALGLEVQVPENPRLTAALALPAWRRKANLELPVSVRRFGVAA